MDKSKLNFFKKPKSKIYETVFDHLLLESQNLDTIEFRKGIELILKKYGFIKKTQKKFNSTNTYETKDELIIFLHNGNKLYFEDRKYKLTYKGLTQQKSQAIEDEFYKIGYLKKKTSF